MLRVGAHLSIAGNLTNALDKTLEIGGNCLQIFSSSPRQWKRIPISDEQIAAFVQKKTVLDIAPIYFHAPYLINLADKERIGEISVTLLSEELRLASRMGIRGTIVHLGSFKDQAPDYEHVINNVQKVLSQTPDDTFFIIENAGNKKIGAKLEEIGYLTNNLTSPRIKVCLDTCHMWAAGYDISTPMRFDEYFLRFDKEIGLEKLEVLQINDSKDQPGSFRDRHENIGEGTIPSTTFHLLLTNPKTKNLPFILETPGFDKKGPDKKNIEILKSLVSTPVLT